MIPSIIKIKNDKLPECPGVYLMKNAEGTVIYVGKATSLKRRVPNHFIRPHSPQIAEMTTKVVEIDYIEKPTALEALILEANLIKYYFPKYNIRDRDNKSFLYLVITDEDFPRPLLIRGTDLEEQQAKKAKAVFGPYTSPRSLRAALDYIRKIFPWSTCLPGQPRACFYVHLGLCPGVCIGTADKKAYAKTIRDLIAFFEGRKEEIVKRYQKEMKKLAAEQRFEEATVIRNRLFSLEHIQDIAIMKREDEEVDRIREGEAPIDLYGRIEGYDISNISGTSSVASMVVFENGAPAKAEYRKFRIKSVVGANDVASLQEVLMRRFRNDWRKPDLLLIDGGLPQVHAVEQVIHHLNLGIPVVGIAKGPERKRNDVICGSKVNKAICDICEKQVDLLAAVRDEAHRFAIGYHRNLRGRRFLGKDIPVDT
jgi:excinuclease ABC subunit C